MDCANGYHASSRILISVFDCQLGIFDLMGSYFSPSSPVCSKIRSLLQDETQPSITEAVRALFRAPYIAIMDNEYCGRN
ncbi:MAG: hypothetical protein P8I83_01090 [Paracoccaceae bacterium]|nr:hypothetical protein [Paracoccaceae bacterium]